MNMHDCPHCGEKGISALRRCNLGPAFPTKCKSCGKKVGIPYWSIFTIIPMLTAVIVVPWLFDNTRIVAFGAVMLTILTWNLFESIVPLIKKQ